MLSRVSEPSRECLIVAFELTPDTSLLCMTRLVVATWW